MTAHIRIDGYEPDTPAMRRFVERNAAILPLIRIERPFAALPAAEAPEPEPEPVRRDIINLMTPEEIEKANIGERRRKWLLIVNEVLSKHAAMLEAKGFTPPMLWSPQRPDWLCLIRHEIWWRVHRDLAWSYPEIGRASGDRDHTTIIYGVRQYKKRMGAAE